MGSTIKELILLPAPCGSKFFPLIVDPIGKESKFSPFRVDPFPEGESCTESHKIVSLVSRSTESADGVVT